VIVIFEIDFLLKLEVPILVFLSEAYLPRAHTPCRVFFIRCAFSCADIIYSVNGFFIAAANSDSIQLRIS